MTAWYSLSVLLHLVAAALWLGAIVFFLVVSGPAVHPLEPSIAIKAMNQGRIGLERISWAAIGVLLLTGITSLIVRSRAAGPTLSTSEVIFVSAKLFLFGAMATHHGLQVFKYAPHISALTATIPPDAAEWPEPLLAHWRRWFLLLKINAGLGPIAVLLGLTLGRG